MTNLKPNAELAYRVLDHIDAHPSEWNQTVWVLNEGDCGTSACAAGWTCLLAGDQPRFHSDGDPEAEYVTPGGKRSRVYIPDRAAELLGMEPDGGEQTGYRLFEPNNTRDDLGRLVAEIFGPRPVTDAHRDDACRAIAAELDRHPDGL